MRYKWLSRKFLIAVAAILMAVDAGNSWAAALAAGVYVLAEAHVDANR